MLRFADDWLGLSTLSNLVKDGTAFPDFNTEIQAAMAEETRRFLSSVLFDEKGHAVQPADRALHLHGRPAVQVLRPARPAGADFTRVMRPAGWGVGRAGPGRPAVGRVTQPSTSPTKRGYFVRTRRAVRGGAAAAGQRRRSARAHRRRDHAQALRGAAPGGRRLQGAATPMFDPIGFAFEHLDATGRYPSQGRHTSTSTTAAW